MTCSVAKFANVELGCQWQDTSCVATVELSCHVANVAMSPMLPSCQCCQCCHLASVASCGRKRFVQRAVVSFSSLEWMTDPGIQRTHPTKKEVGLKKKKIVDIYSICHRKIIKEKKCTFFSKSLHFKYILYNVKTNLRKNLALE